MAPSSRRQTHRLHLGRISASDACYFITFVTAARKPWLGNTDNLSSVLQVLSSWHEQNNSGDLLAATIMPDHVHVLCRLGSDRTVGQCVGQWKTESRRQIHYAENWQRDFWEHRLRRDETWEDYGLYMFLNPYRAGLLKGNAVWPGWLAPQSKKFRFPSALDERGAPPDEWLHWPETRFEGLAAGE